MYKRVKLGKTITMDIQGLHQEIKERTDKSSSKWHIFSEIAEWVEEGVKKEECETGIKRGY